METEVFLQRANNIFVLLALTAMQVSFAEPLSLETVFKSTRDFHPKISVELQKLDSAKGKLMSSEAAFDLRLSAKGQSQSTGYYQNREIGTRLDQPISFGGISLYGGWRWSGGLFPNYDGKRVTGTDGEIFAGIDIPLLRGRATDSQRTAIATAKAQTKQAQAQVDVTLINSLHEAAIKYWSWIEAVQQLKINQELLAFAEARQQFIQAKIKHGDLPAMEAVDNRRTILNRTNKIVESERDVEQAAIQLSFYYRDSKGDPIVPSSNSAPTGFPDPKTLPMGEGEKRFARAVELRPEFARIRAMIAEVDMKEKLAENDLLPQLSLFGETSQDLGNSDPTRSQGEFRAGLQISIPLQRRKAKGARTVARAGRLQVEKQLQLLSDQAKMEVGYSIASLVATFQQAELAREEVSVNRKLVEGERIRFKRGDSPILIVNMRELSLGDARIRLNKALSNHQKARVRLLAVTGELKNQ